MLFFSHWFSKARPPAHPMTLVAHVPLHSLFIFQGESDDYEQILASIERDIQKRQTRLSEIRIRERRTTLKVTLYTLAFWVVYVSLWYAQVLPMLSGHRPNTAFEKFVKGVPVLIGPIL
jgi:endoplasmic reticulum junction formation protein lunapark